MAKTFFIKTFDDLLDVADRDNVEALKEYLNEKIDASVRYREQHGEPIQLGEKCILFNDITKKDSKDV